MVPDAANAGARRVPYDFTRSNPFPRERFARRIRLVAYGASLESWLGASPRGFESPILRHSFTGWAQAQHPQMGFESPILRHV